MSKLSSLLPSLLIIGASVWIGYYVVDSAMHAVYSWHMLVEEAKGADPAGVVAIEKLHDFGSDQADKVCRIMYPLIVILICGVLGVIRAQSQKKTPLSPSG